MSYECFHSFAFLNVFYWNYNIEQNMLSIWEDLTRQVNAWLYFNAMSHNKSAHEIICSLILIR